MRPRRKKKPRQKERKGIYILPNLFTSASLFSGFYAIIAATGGRYVDAAVAILISAILDGLDGRVARLTQTTSQFGVEFDSLSDVIAFGVAPGVLAYQWALSDIKRFGWLAAFLFVICGALRLARFNVQQNTTDPNYFRGLPIPAGACFIASFILFMDEIGGVPRNWPLLIVVTIYIISFLMVSTVSYSSFKKLEFQNRRPFNVLVSLILILIVIAYKPKIMIFFVMFFYVLSGPVLSLYRLRHRRWRRLGEGAETAESAHPQIPDRQIENGESS